MSIPGCVNVAGTLEDPLFDQGVLVSPDWSFGKSAIAQQPPRRPPSRRHEGEPQRCELRCSGDPQEVFGLVEQVLEPLVAGDYVGGRIAHHAEEMVRRRRRIALVRDRLRELAVVQGFK